MHSRFRTAINQVGRDLKLLSYEVDGKRWQSVDVSDKPEMKMREIFNTSFSVSLNHEDYHDYQTDIGPNLPWADDHFEERVGGQPLNPGVEWRNWPWAQSADNFRTEGESKFSHTYMERYWPKGAGKITAHGGEWNNGHGIRYALGDLADVLDHLFSNPETRQAYLPVWFPEDTGVVHKERVPCTLGYHFLVRHGYLHCTYYIRSCDFVRHFRDDLYLSLRLQLWVLDQLRGMVGLPEDYNWQAVKPGMFVFHCVSMHCFENDYQAICEDF
jgi:hypothetical protein